MNIAAFLSRTTLAALVLATAFSMGTSVVFAQNTLGSNPYPSSNTSGSSGALQNPLNIGNCSGTNNAQCIASFLQAILQIVVQIGSIAIILMLVFIGFKYVTAQGAPGKLEQIHNMLLWTIVGALILLGAQAIATGIQATVQAL